MSHLQQLSWVVTDDILSTCPNGKLPLDLKIGESPMEKEIDDGEGLTINELQEILRQRLPQTNCALVRLPEYEIIRLI